MGEIKRVLFNKKYIALLLTIFIANIAVFQYFQVEALGRMNSEEELEIFIYELEQKQQEEHDKFYRKIKEVPRQKANMLEMSIFAEEDSFAYKNIMKTAGDYERISEVELSEINDYAVDAFLEYDVMYIFGFVLMMFTVTAFLDERKKGLWQIVYTCRGGRLRLLLKRVAILLGVALVTETVLVVSTLSVSFMNYGGIGILFDSVQSVGKLQGFMMPVSTLSFLVYYILFLAASHAVSGLFIWFVLSLIHNGNLGMVVCAIVYVTEFFLNYMISSRNPLSILKYTNLWFFINPRETFTEYTNIMFAGTLLNVREYLTVTLVVLVILLCAVAVVTGIKTKPFYTPGVIETVLNMISDKMRRLLCHLGGMGYEVYKMLIQKKGILVIAGFCYLLISNMDTLELLLGSDRIQLDAFYEEYMGEINQESLAAYDSIEEEINMALEAGESPGEAKLSMFDMLKEQKEYAQKLEDRGIKGWFINDRGFELLFGKLKSGKRMIDGVIVLIALVLIVAPVYAMEYRSGVKYMIASTKRGRSSIYWRKTFYSIVCAAAFAAVMFFVRFYEVRTKYNLKGLAAPVQNIRIYENVSLNVSIGEYMALWYGARAMLFVMATCIVMMISACVKKQNKVYLLSMLLVPIGLLNGIVEYPIIISIVVSVAISVMCCIRTYNEWTNTGRKIA